MKFLRYDQIYMPVVVHRPVSYLALNPLCLTEESESNLMNIWLPFDL